ncbi:glycosyl hydrolase family 8 [Erwiniaceae bacterium BAC15a-03b]|uniref:cellulase n=1 Tax=Winslowiella arboricola TaxID=2978220 RepID=A0A9J6PK45_9GAMM|nr:glycosyl hydrolase family 8 [Winslowiella arboricola]MCU5773836.1 glycosyl hydrolase family 8 [Winslowiella arboricola]MCU5777746.1 glycosyl hydrolase family 8 [Winslowiella arboricola]
MLLVLSLISAQSLAADGWSSYKSRFLAADGRIRDTANNNVSHTEGQGFAMLLAVDNNDRQTFDRLWQWTRTHLTNPQNGLFYWRYNPEASDPVVDKNNASDGDVLIAWALLRGGEKWQVADYLQQSDKIQRAIVSHDVITFANRTLMLPGAQGFNKNTYVIINPSYFLFPAWRDFARRSHLQVWTQLINDGFALLGEMNFGASALPLDWVALNADGSMAPAIAWPSRFSYDAIRIPLYIWWYDKQSLRLVPFQRFWANYSRLQTPAWINVSSNEAAPYNMAGGLLAVRDLTMGDSAQLSDTLDASEDYYSASLRLLVWLAWQNR